MYKQTIEERMCTIMQEMEERRTKDLSELRACIGKWLNDNFATQEQRLILADQLVEMLGHGPLGNRLRETFECLKHDLKPWEEN